jgi:pentatricopeptide repeat protein
MNKFKKFVAIVIIGILNFCILINYTLSEEKESINNGVEVDEMEEMLETLKRERVELDKLKSELVDSVRQKEEVLKVHKEKELKKNEKVILTNFVKESVGNKEKLVDEQGRFSLHNKVVKDKDIIVQGIEDSDEEVEESEKVIKNGDEIIHPFEIAGNLYKLGEYKAAVDIYKLVLKNDTENDKRIWITYQIANCYRKLGLYTDAMKVYREMRQAYEGTYWAKQAQWYIQDIEWRSKVEEKFDTVVKR